jgi:hypothetical protein
MPRARIVTALSATLLLAMLAVPAAGSAQSVPASLCNGGTAPTVSSQVPADTITNQGALNCFAWQEFIALNWQADTATCAAASTPASSFGNPGTAPSVWETFKSPDAVFLKDAAKPAGWCRSVGQTTTTGAAQTKSLSGLNKFADAGVVDLHEITQTDPTSSWLTAQSGLLTLYEVHLNEDEFNYIYTNTLYDAKKQTEHALTKGIQLPDGGPDSKPYGDTGSIELKAAWLELPNKADWPNYKTSKALVRYPGEKAKVVTVGLVGLHIIHKTQSAQQFVWATFEHVDNVPESATTDSGQFTYFNPACDPSTDHYKCKVNRVPTIPCKSESPPDPKVCDPYDAPMQIVRTTPLNNSPTNPIVQLNSAVQEMIASTNSDSVFQNYELVNVLWPDNSTEIERGARVPLTCGDATPPPSQEIVANAVIETFLQGGTTGEPDPQPDPCNAGARDYRGDTCLTCHTFGNVASTTSSEPVLKVGNTKGKKPALATDYSFLLSQAQLPPSATEDDGGGGSALTWVAIAAGLGLLGAGGFLVAKRRRDQPAE